MKKVLALVLAVMMLSTMAFAADFTISVNGNPNGGVSTSGSNTVTIDAGNYQPGDKIYIYKNSGTGSSPDVEEINSDNYSITKEKYEEGRSLVEDVYFDDDNNQVVVELRENYTLTANKTLDMSFVLKGKGRNIKDITVEIKNATVGYGLVEGYITITDTDQVEFSVDQDDDANYYKVTKTNASVTASYGEMEFTTTNPDVDVVVRVYDGDELYLYNDVKADKDILKAYADADADLTFLNFPNTTFNSTATLYMYMDEDSYIYEEKDGKLVASDAEWSEDDGCFILKTRTLGNYVFSDVELDTVTETVDDTVENPDTGANDVVGIAAALGVVALVSAAAVSLKK